MPELRHPHSSGRLRLHDREPGVGDDVQRLTIRFGSGAVAALLISAATVHGQTRHGTVNITITSRTPNAVQVEERFVISPLSQPLELRVLTRPCMVIEYVNFERNGVAWAPPQVRKGPWISWRDSTAAGSDSLRLLVRYNVWLGGSRTIPLVHLTSPGRETVTVTTRFAKAEGEVEFPHMTRQAPAEWRGQYVATPAFVKVGGFAFACDRLPPPGDNGGLVWRFALLVGIMVAWVPLYLAWARRSGEGA